MDNVVHDMQETLNDIRRASSHIETIHRDTAVEVSNMLSEVCKVMVPFSV